MLTTEDYTGDGAMRMVCLNSASSQGIDISFQAYMFHVKFGSKSLISWDEKIGFVANLLKGSL